MNLIKKSFTKRYWENKKELFGLIFMEELTDIEAANQLHISRQYVHRMRKKSYESILGDKLELISPIMILLIPLMIADYISRTLSSKKESVEHLDDKSFGWSSKIIVHKAVMGQEFSIKYISGTLPLGDTLLT